MWRDMTLTRSFIYLFNFRFIIVVVIRRRLILQTCKLWPICCDQNNEHTHTYIANRFCFLSFFLSFFLFFITRSVVSFLSSSFYFSLVKVVSFSSWLLLPLLLLLLLWKPIRAFMLKSLIYFMFDVFLFCCCCFFVVVVAVVVGK